MENIEAAFNKATEAGKQEVAPAEDAGKQIQAPTVTEATVPQENKGQVEAQPTPTEKQNEEWDGDVNKLPPELQTWAKKAQAGLTKRAMAESELRRKGQEYLALTQSEDWKKFQELKNQPSAPQTPASTPAQTTGITPEEWEAALLDTTGQIANQLIQRENQRQIAAAIEQYGGVINALTQKTTMAEFRSTLSEFVDMHPDAQELYEDGIIEPLLDQEIKSGQHQSYESAIQSAYDKGLKIKIAAEARALKQAQGRVAEKKGAVTATGISTGELTSVEVPKGDVFQKAFEAAIQGKKVNVKAKK